MRAFGSFLIGCVVSITAGGIVAPLFGADPRRQASQWNGYWVVGISCVVFAVIGCLAYKALSDARKMKKVLPVSSPVPVAMAVAEKKDAQN